MILSKTAKVKWNSRNKKRLVDLGYIYTKMGDEIDVKIEDLSSNNQSLVMVQCDYCGKPYEAIYRMLSATIKKTISEKHTCPNCVGEKIKESNMIKYGCEHHIASELVRDKIKKTNLDKYGVVNVFEAKEIKEKILETNLNKYGTTTFTKTQEYKIKTKLTCLEKYGQTNHMKLEEYKNMFRGENSPRWKGGVEFHRQERATFEYNQWRKAIFTKNSYTCQCCGKHGGELNAHHIFNWKDYPDLRYNIDNGVTFCQECHNKFHSTYGKRKNNKEQVNNFIINYGKKVC